MNDAAIMPAVRYTRTAVALHWLIALLILAAIPLGMTMTELILSPTKLKLYSWHKWLGVGIFFLVVLRLAWRLWYRPPALPETMPGWQRAAAGLSHGLLYLLMLAIPLSGWLMSSAKGFQTVWFGIWPIPDLIGRDPAWGDFFEETHEALVGLLLGLLVLHVAAAIKHHVIGRDDVLTRMLPWLKRKE
jgi:cytochrome b561